MRPFRGLGVRCYPTWAMVPLLYKTDWAEELD